LNKTAAFAALLSVLIPRATFADTSPALNVPAIPQVVQHVYVHKGTQIDVALPIGVAQTFDAIIDDPRWTMRTVKTGGRYYVTFKAGGIMPGPDLAIIPTSEGNLHLALSSGANESTTYAVYFFDPHPRSAPTVRHQAVAQMRNPPSATSPKPLARSCNDPRLDNNYKVKGDKRIDVAAACDDSVHTYVQVNLHRNSPSVVLYKVVAGQDQIVNGPPPEKDDKRIWFTADEIGDKFVLVSDSAKGHIRTEVTHG
jgi:hypothetical protein